MDAGHSNRRSIRSMFFSKKRSASNLQQTNPEYGAPRRIPKPLDPISRQPCAATVSGPIEDEDVPLDLSNLCPPPSTPEFSASPERTASPAPNALIWLPDEEVWIKAGPSVDAAEAERAQWERAQREAQMMQLSNLLHPPSSPPRIVLDDDDDHCQLLTPEVVPPPCYVQSQWEEATKRQTARPGWWESVAERRLGTSA
ncbi:MAG: hypothetical protein M1825_006376 [Sarcosagium campestre]|nr:MAG: hypothetical protein M1825_006376 [Sarcosagium campestre]